MTRARADGAWFPRSGSKRERMLALIQRPGGAASSELQAAMEVSSAAVVTHLSALEGRHVIFWAKRAGERLRWFGTAAEAMTWQTQVALPAPATLAQGAMAPRGEAESPAGVQVRRGLAAGFDPRYQLPPDWKPGPGSFSAAGVGIDPMTGQAWR